VNTPDNDLLARLRTDFQHEVESVPEVDLAAGVASRARRNRRQRVVLGAAGVAFVVAIVPVSVLAIRNATDAGRAPGPGRPEHQRATPHGLDAARHHHADGHLAATGRARGPSPVGAAAGRRGTSRPLPAEQEVV